ncbi:MAG: aldehyde dehydrogenase family protein [Planctomycetes bacterium]|nr:aldehyde dehydrogenase family protein [Planctomycetota bacterium]
MRTEPLYLCGRWVETGQRATITNPFTGEPVRQVAQATEQEADEAAREAARAFEETRRLPVHARAEILRTTSGRIAERADEFARAIVEESGKPVKFARGEVERAALTFRMAAEGVGRSAGELVPLDVTKATEGYFGYCVRVPRGPVLAIAPFNFPLNLVAHKVAPAIATGSPVVVKPPPQAPAAALLLAGIVGETAWPKGALSVLPAPVVVAERMVAEERFKTVSFTGSDRVGWRIKERAGKKKVLLEMGGNAAAIVHSDAELAWAAERLALGAFAHAGQVCIKVQRVYVERPAFAEFCERFVEAARKLPVGDPARPETVVGPMIDEDSAKRVEAWIVEAKGRGARALLEGARRGNVLPPCVLVDVPDDARVSCQEVFGPVAVLAAYETFGEAIARANASAYGLQAGVFTRDLGRVQEAVRSLDVGGVIVNDYPTFRVDNMPYGGVKDSGIGREGLAFAMEELSQIKMVAMRF